MPELRQLTRTRDEETETTEPAETTRPTEPTAAGEPTTEPTGTDTTLEADGASVTVSGEPTEAEAAIVAAVVAEHLRTEAAAAEEEEEEESRYAVDPWCLSGRLDIRSPERTPRACPSGTEWKVAGRAASW